MRRNRLSLEIHLDKDLVAKPNKSACVPVAVNFRKFCEPIPVDVLIQEMRFVAIEAVGDEDWNIILPFIPRCCREQYPIIGFGDL